MEGEKNEINIKGAICCLAAVAGGGEVLVPPPPLDIPPHHLPKLRNVSHNWLHTHTYVVDNIVVIIPTGKNKIIKSFGRRKKQKLYSQMYICGVSFL